MQESFGSDDPSMKVISAVRLEKEKGFLGFPGLVQGSKEV